MNLLSPRMVTGALVLFVASAAPAEPARVSAQQHTPPKIRALPTETKQWKGDFDGMVMR